MKIESFICYQAQMSLVTGRWNDEHKVDRSPKLHLKWISHLITCIMEGETHKNSYTNKNVQQDKVNELPNAATFLFKH